MGPRLSGLLVKEAPDGRVGHIAGYSHGLGDYIRAALPHGYVVRACDETYRDDHTVEPEEMPEPLTPGPPDIWELHPWVRGAANAAKAGQPAVVAWDFQLRPPMSRTRGLLPRPLGSRESSRRAQGVDQRAFQAHRTFTPQRDRLLLLDTLHSAGQAIRSHVSVDQLLHGEPHPGNLLNTSAGLLFIALETCCRGPIGFDVAHVPDEVSVHHPGVNQALLQECRRLVLAMVATWRWEARDEFPNGRRHAIQILGIVLTVPLRAQGACVICV